VKSLETLLHGPVTKDLCALEKKLDDYIASSWKWLRSERESVISRFGSWRLTWARKRSSSFNDDRAKMVLKWALGQAGQLNLLEDYLSAYDKGQYKGREPLIDTVSRLLSMYGYGWFFEWPDGRPPLSTTWPWADVRPALVVLWGVCWKFFAAATHSRRLGPRVDVRNMDVRNMLPWASEFPGKSITRSLLLFCWS
jgi:hypothetical protein